MPVTYSGFTIKPVGFFDSNPALDVPPPPTTAAPATVTPLKTVSLTIVRATLSSASGKDFRKLAKVRTVSPYAGDTVAL